MRKVLSLIAITLVFLTLATTLASASENFSSPAAASNYAKFGDLTMSADPTTMIQHIKQNKVTELSYQTSGCSVGCSNGCSNGCSTGCSNGCSNGCSSGCSTGCSSGCSY